MLTEKSHTSNNRQLSNLPEQMRLHQTAELQHGTTYCTLKLLDSDSLAQFTQRKLNKQAHILSIGGRSYVISVKNTRLTLQLDFPASL